MGYYEKARDAFRRGDTDVVERLSRQELDRSRASADVAAEVEALCMLARVALRGDDAREAVRLAAEARALARGTGERRLERVPIHVLAASARITGDLAAARSLYGESIALNESLGESRMVVAEQHNLGYVELRAGDVDRARELFTAARRQTLRHGHDDLMPCVAVDAAVIAAADGDHRRAARLLAAADSALRELQQVLDPDDAIEQAALRDRLAGALGRRSFDAAYREGAGLDLRQALSL